MGGSGSAESIGAAEDLGAAVAESDAVKYFFTDGEEFFVENNALPLGCGVDFAVVFFFDDVGVDFADFEPSEDFKDEAIDFFKEPVDEDADFEDTTFFFEAGIC